MNKNHIIFYFYYNILVTLKMGKKTVVCEIMYRQLVWPVIQYYQTVGQPLKWSVRLRQFQTQKRRTPLWPVLHDPIWESRGRIQLSHRRVQTPPPLI